MLHGYHMTYGNSESSVWLSALNILYSNYVHLAFLKE